MLPVLLLFLLFGMNLALPFGPCFSWYCIFIYITVSLDKFMKKEEEKIEKQLDT